MPSLLLVVLYGCVTMLPPVTPFLLNTSVIPLRGIPEDDNAEVIESETTLGSPNATPSQHSS
jgi:hypothetical protein